MLVALSLLLSIRVNQSIEVIPMSDDTENSNQSLDCSQEERREYALQTEIESSTQRAAVERSRSEALEKLNEIQHNLNHTVAEVGIETHYNEVPQPNQIHQEEALSGLVLGGVLCVKSVQEMYQQHQQQKEEKMEQLIAIPNDPIIESRNEVFQEVLQNDLRQRQEYTTEQNMENAVTDDIMTENIAVNEAAVENIITDQNEVSIGQDNSIGLESD